MTKKRSKEIIDPIKPHTVRKIKLIEKYVDGWARKILGFNGKPGQNPSKGVIYIDCMSNCGIYYDREGNIIEGTAILVAKKLNDIVSNYPGKNAILIFNDISKDRIERLRQEIADRNLNNITVYYYNTDCNQLLRELDIKSLNKSHNTLLLYDPYNASIDWDAIEPYLNQWGEVIINHMVYDTNMNIAHTTAPVLLERYKNTYQGDIETIISKGTSKHELNKTILSIIDNRTLNSNYQHYIAYFPFFNRANGLVYYLLHCCVNVEGIKLFKATAWKTFGDHSSTKDTHGMDSQMSFFSEGCFGTITDQECYNIHDVAKYVYEKYHNRKEISLREIYFDLDRHPVFPSDGYKADIKKELREIYNVSFPKGQDKAVFND